MSDRMTPLELANGLKMLMSAIDELSAEMDDSSIFCECCGLTKRQNFDDHQAKQALDGAYGRIVKLREKLLANEWAERPVLDVTQASELRRR